MGRNWDAELIEDRSFTLGGEVFEWAYPPWEIGGKILDDSLEPASKNGDGGTEAEEWTFVKDTKLAIDRIPMFLNPKNDAVKRFKALAARKTDPVPRFQFVQVYQWLIQVTGGLPTTPPSEPSSGGGDQETSSSAASSSQEETSTT